MLVIRIRTSWCGNGSGSLPAREQPAAQAPGTAVGQMGIPAAQVGAGGFCWVQPRQAIQERDEPADQLQGGFLDRPFSGRGGGHGAWRR